MNSLFMDSDIIIDLLAEREHHGAAAALMTLIVTRNRKDYTKGRLKVVTAQEYLNMHEAAEHAGKG